jgi:hypothetical protein
MFLSYIPKLIAAYSLCLIAGAQDRHSHSIANATAVPRLIRFSGTHTVVGNQSPAGVVGASFSIYREEHGGTPLWIETQNVEFDKDGNYTALLGSATNDGLPVELFNGAEPRWLEVRLYTPAEVIKPRVLLGSVPYALKAADADTLGGLPASAYVRVSDAALAGVTMTAAPGGLTGVSPLLIATHSAAANPLFGTTGTPNYLGMFAANGTDLTQSLLYQSGNTIVNEMDGGSSYGPTLSLMNTAGFGIGQFDFYTYGGQTVPSARWQASDVGGFTADQAFYTSRGGSANQPLVQRMIIKGATGNVGIGTSNPADTLTVQGSITTEVDGGPLAGPVIKLKNTAGNGVGSFDFYTYTNQTIPSARWQAADVGGFTADHVFWTSQGGNANQPLVERMRIKGQTGNVGIGTSTPVAKLEVNGNAQVDGNLTVSGSILGSGSTGPIVVALNNGSNNFSAGIGSLPASTTGNGNTAVGDTALSWNSTGTGNTAVGYRTLVNNTTGSFNTAIGNVALQNNTTGGPNTAVGFSVLASNTTGAGNAALGSTALHKNSTGSSNTAIGDAALWSNTTGYQNTAVGQNAVVSNTTGFYNTGVGVAAVQLNTTGWQNTGLGYYALSDNTTGFSNTAVGFNALINSASGSYNTAIGSGAGQSLQSGSNNVYISNLGASSESGAIRIGSLSSQTAAFIAGIRGVTTANNDAVPVVIDSNGQLGTMSSSRRFKEDIQDMAEASDGLMQLRPVTFRYKRPFDDGSKPIQYGLIAEEVAEVYPDLVARSVDGQIETVKYQVLDSMLLNELQKQRAQITSLVEQVSRKDQELAGQRSLIHSLDERLSRLERVLESESR